MKQKILITGFAPFGGESVNPAYEAVKSLPETIDGVEIVKREIPVVFHESGQKLKEMMEELTAQEPDELLAVLCIGQAGGRAGITVERIAINEMNAREPDNAGFRPDMEVIDGNGPAAYFTTVPVKKMVERIQSAGVPASISYTAGTYVCNSTLYELLQLCENRFPLVKAGFIHVPYAVEQGIGKAAATPTMEIGTIARALEAALQAVIEEVCKTDGNGKGECE